MLILDEPTVYLDEEHRDAVVNAFKNINLKENGRQMFIVTHDTSFENTGGKVMVVHNIGGVSKIKEI